MAGPLARRPALRVAAAAGFAAWLAASLSACKDVGAEPLTPAGAALVASAPAMSTARVPAPPRIASAAASGDLDAVEAQLASTLAGASACSADAECRSVAVGAKACGGPTGYRAYSGKAASAAGVDALARQERELAARAARESHQVSTCFMLADPGAHCQQNKCVTGPADPG